MNPIKSAHKIIVVIVAVFLCLIVYFSFLSQSANDVGYEDTTKVSQVQPVIGLETILTVSDVQQALMEAASSGNEAQIEKWQSQILLVAKEAGYAAEELDFLAGAQGVEYLRFRGVRLLFQRDVKQAYRSGEGLGDLFRRYPEAEDWFQQTEQLFVQRDQIIQSIAQTLIDSSQSLSQPQTQQGALSVEEAQRAALQIWRERNGTVTQVSP